MSEYTVSTNGRFANPWRVAAWSFVAVLLLAPLVAMQFSDEVNWTVGDFAIAGVLLIGTGLVFEFVVGRSGDITYRAGWGVALLAAVLLVWVNGAVGIIGSEGNSANLMYGGVLAVGVIGVLLARFESRRMAWALFATAAAVALVAVIALVAGLGAPASGPVEIIVINAFFVILFVCAALLFRIAGDRMSEHDNS